MNRKGVGLAAIFFVLILVFVYFFFLNHAGDSQLRSIEIGVVDSVQGNVQSRLARTLRFEKLLFHSKIHNQEVIQTEKDSEAVISFTTSTTLHLAERTRFVAEEDASRPGALIGTVIEGHVAVLQATKANLFRLYYQGHELPLSGQVASGPAVVTPTRGAQPGAGGLIITATLPDDSELPPAKATPGSQNQSANTDDTTDSEPASDVLTNEDIVRQLRGQTGFFQRCYLSFMHRGARRRRSKIKQNEWNHHG